MWSCYTEKEKLNRWRRVTQHRGGTSERSGAVLFFVCLFVCCFQTERGWELNNWSTKPILGPKTKNNNLTFHKRCLRGVWLSEKKEEEEEEEEEKRINNWKKKQDFNVVYFSVTQHSTFLQNGALCVCSRVSSVALGMVLSGQCTRPVRQTVHRFGPNSHWTGRC